MALVVFFNVILPAILLGTEAFFLYREIVKPWIDQSKKCRRKEQ